MSGLYVVHNTHAHILSQRKHDDGQEAHEKSTTFTYRQSCTYRRSCFRAVPQAATQVVLLRRAEGDSDMRLLHNPSSGTALINSFDAGAGTGATAAASSETSQRPGATFAPRSTAGAAAPDAPRTPASPLKAPLALFQRPETPPPCRRKDPPRKVPRRYRSHLSL